MLATNTTQHNTHTHTRASALTHNTPEGRASHQRSSEQRRPTRTRRPLHATTATAGGPAWGWCSTAGQTTPAHHRHHQQPLQVALVRHVVGAPLEAACRGWWWPRVPRSQPHQSSRCQHRQLPQPRRLHRRLRPARSIGRRCCRGPDGSRLACGSTTGTSDGRSRGGSSRSRGAGMPASPPWRGPGESAHRPAPSAWL